MSLGVRLGVSVWIFAVGDIYPVSARAGCNVLAQLSLMKLCANVLLCFVHWKA